ncbi:MAG: T9SS type A sorting domain-containing protein, partial [Flavobacteriales bacterium]|nr:T9SS type A sorting domain-containing protein [Flavobacteriales bacterium]
AGSYLYYGSKSGIHRSNDDGNTWALSGTGISVSASNFGRFFYEFGGTYFCVMSSAAVNGGGLFKSSDGLSWSPAITGMAGGGETCYQMTKINNKLYIGTNFDLYESTDNGASWSSIATSGTKVYSGLAEHLGRWFVHTTFGMEYSDDGGVTWDTLTSAIKSSTYCGFEKGSNDTLYAYSAASGIFYSVDTGNTWIDIKGDLSANDIQFMQGAKFFNGALYVATILAVKSNGSGSSSTSVSENFDSGLSIYPNPFRDALFIDNRLSHNLELRLYNNQGIEVTKATSNNQKYWLDTSRLAKGIYFLKIVDETTKQPIPTQTLINY